MKRIILLIACLTVFEVAAFAQSKIAIFDPVGDVSDAIKSIVREEVCSVIVGNPDYIVLERANIDKVLEENKFQGQYASETDMSELGKMMGADYVCVITIVQAEPNPQYYIFCKQVDVNNAVIINQGEGKTDIAKEFICAAKESALFFAVDEKEFKKIIDQERKSIREERISKQLRNRVKQQLDLEQKANSEKTEPTASKGKPSTQRKPVAAKNETKPANTRKAKVEEELEEEPKAKAKVEAEPEEEAEEEYEEEEYEEDSGAEEYNFYGMDFILVESPGGQDFYIGKYEVTQFIWRSVMGKNPPAEFKGENFPVESADLNDIKKFIKVLNKQSGLKFRLPTESEWLYAAEGGKYNEGMDYSGSDDIGEVAWYTGNSQRRTHAVGLKEPNALGIYDMTGNVWELCNENPFMLRLRGGAWNSDANKCKLPQYITGIGGKSYSHVGFRLVLPVDSDRDD